MTEKRRGRPPKGSYVETVGEAFVAPKGCPECGQAEGHYDDCPAGMGVSVVAAMPVAAGAMDSIVQAAREDNKRRDKAQAYANRVWVGQSPDVKHAERIARVKRALAGQNLPFEGVVLP